MINNSYITGGFGFIDFNLGLRLISKGYSVRVLDNFSRTSHFDPFHRIFTKDIPDYSIAVGNPAKVIKKYNFSTKYWEKVNI
jgi:nucleoside-diphosphate-sugar epimerase